MTVRLQQRVAILALALGAFSTCLPVAAKPEKRPASPQASAPASSPAAAHAHYAAGVVHEQADESELALEEFTQAALLDPDNEMLTLEVSQRLLTRQQPERALEILRPAAARPGVSSAIFIRLGYAYTQLGRVEDSISANRQAIKLAPKEFSGYQNLYLNLLQNNQSAEALKVLRQAAKASDVDAEFLVNLAEMFVNYGQQIPSRRSEVRAEALEALHRAAQIKPQPPRLRLKLADGFNALGEDVPALALYRSLVKEFADTPLLRDNIRARLTELYLRAGDRPAAMEQIRALVANDPANVAALYQLGDLAQDEHDFALAEDCFRKVVLLRPEFEPPYYELAQAQLSANHLQDALATLTRAQKKFQASYVSELLAGIAYGQLKEFDQAISRFTSAELLAQTNEPKRLNEVFYYQLGSIYERKGDKVQAEQCLHKSLAIAPGFADAQNFLGYMWAERGTNLAAARALIEQAVQSEPKNAAFVDSLGWVLFKSGQGPAALPHILKAIELANEPDATLLDHLGDIYAALKQPDKARAAWKKSLAIEPNPAIRKKLDSTPAK